jgi:hypothetical protein
LPPDHDATRAERRVDVEPFDFYDLVNEFFGHRATQVGFDDTAKVFTCILYETFPFTCGLDGNHGEFGASVEVSPKRVNTQFFGEALSLNSDPQSIRASLERVDEWCRLHLPEKFLERYDAAIAGK